MNDNIDKIQYLKNFSQEFLKVLQNCNKIVVSCEDDYFFYDKDDILDSLKECLNEYEKKENRESK